MLSIGCIQNLTVGVQVMKELLMMSRSRGSGGSTDKDVPIAGDMTLGYFGEVKAVDFINGNELRALYYYHGIQHNVHAGWLKFALDGKTLYVAKKTLSYKLSWGDAALAYANIMVRGKEYLLRSLTGVNTHPYTGGTGNDPTGTSGTEWNKLMYRVCATPEGISNEGIVFGEWAQYSNGELGFSGNGSDSWIRGLKSPNSGLLRGGTGVTNLSLYGTGLVGRDNQGFRPVLELVE